MSKRYTITAALPYTNGPIHIGHLAGVYVPADIYARYLRLTGNDVFITVEVVLGERLLPTFYHQVNFYLVFIAVMAEFKITAYPAGLTNKLLNDKTF